VNRCLTEGRQAFARRLAGIQGGAECERFAPLLSALADGEASAEDLALLRPHMRTCLACRARLKAFRTLPARVAALVPPAALIAAGAGPLRRWLESIMVGAQQKVDAALGATQQKAALMGERAQAVVELAAGQKVAAVAASAAALAGGGTAVDQLANHRGPPQPRQHQEQRRHLEAKRVKEELPIRAAQVAPAPQPPPQPPPQPAPDPAPTSAPAPTPAPAPAPPPPPPPPNPANEFVPGAAPAPAPTAPAPAPVQPAPSGAGPGGGGGGGSSGPGEFAP